MVVIPPGGGEVIGDSPERRVEILCDGDALHATWSRFGPGREGADLHVHRRHTDIFYVLEGELTVLLGPMGDAVVVPAGTLARVPPLDVHGFRNGSDAEVRYLNLHAPGEGFADFLRALRDGRTLTYDQEPPPADGGRPTAEAVIGGDADAEAIGIAEELSEPGARPEPHVHRRHVESVYVLEGELALTVGDRTLRAAAGTWASVPAGVAHALWSSGPARFLSIHAPNCGFGRLGRALRDGDEQEIAAARAAFDQA